MKRGISRSYQIQVIMCFGVLLILAGIILTIKTDAELMSATDFMGITKKVNAISKESLESGNYEQKLSASGSIATKIKAVRPIVDFRVEVYRGMTMEELAAQLDKSLKSTLKGTGYLFATKCIETGVDPYIAVAIVLHETGCDYGTCSSLVRNCYNVGGVKGSPSCGSSGYIRYASLEQGITSYINMLARGYFSQGLTTPETIGPKYAGSPSWPSKINAYIAKIESR
ncbi:MAG TPA: glucosaminidase domain-containing protein [Candidatus Faecenecus gallistercoris]|uniref:Glucosaminidase domain-containing protein n=1 Tax=Candidatus Faecenecus gallistercoris TaxID=2840793 RepID=A0A9D0Z0X1_9FIRM|nr:glucosaminidase domain-containing protein [Candidatus Faecenecus gallistercoris]